MKNTCRYHYQNLDDMIYSSSDNRAKQTQIGNFRSFLPFIPIKAPKIKILKNEKICWRYYHFTHVHQKSESYDVRFLRCGVRQTKNFCHFGSFLPFYLPLMILNIKKKCLEIYIHTCVPWMKIIWLKKNFKKRKKEKKNTLWPLFMDGYQLPQG